MSKVVFIMGKSSSGKDTIRPQIMQSLPNLNLITQFTTRPKRDGEMDGVEYHFKSEGYFKYILKNNPEDLLEYRKYETIYGTWYYFTLKHVFEKDKNYLVIGTLESYKSFVKEFGKENMIPVYLDVPGSTRVIRSIKRLKDPTDLDVKEICRRYIKDEEDYDDKILEELEIPKLDFCKDNALYHIEDIVNYIKSKL